MWEQNTGYEELGAELTQPLEATLADETVDAAD
jgi:hypothetical protein